MRLKATATLSRTRQLEFELPNDQQVNAEAYCKAAVRDQFGDGGKVGGVMAIDECDECGTESIDLSDCLDCSGRFCNTCFIPEWDVPGWSNGNFRCKYCYDIFRLDLEAEEKMAA